jgi:hypothetical protein
MWPIRTLFCGLWVIACVAASAAETTVGNDYAWPNMTDLLTHLLAKVGPPIKVYRLTMDRDGKVDLWIQDQHRRDLIDAYAYDHGTLHDPVPVKFESYPTVAALDHHVIELTTIDFQRLPGMLDSARKKLDLADARVFSIRLERGDSHGFLTYSDLPIWTFDIDTPRHDGGVEFDLKGKVLYAHKD